MKFIKKFFIIFIFFFTGYLHSMYQWNDQVLNEQFNTQQVKLQETVRLEESVELKEPVKLYETVRLEDLIESEEPVKSYEKELLAEHAKVCVDCKLEDKIRKRIKKLSEELGVIDLKINKMHNDYAILMEKKFIGIKSFKSRERRRFLKDEGLLLSCESGYLFVQEHEGALKREYDGSIHVIDKTKIRLKGYNPFDFELKINKLLEQIHEIKKESRCCNIKNNIIIFIYYIMIGAYRLKAKIPKIIVFKEYVQLCNIIGKCREFDHCLHILYKEKKCIEVKKAKMQIVENIRTKKENCVFSDLVVSCKE